MRERKKEQKLTPKAPKVKVELSVISNCNDCGACCQHMGITPVVLVSGFAGPDYGVNPLPEDLAEELRGILIKVQAGEDVGQGDDKPCIWFDQKKRQCRHYDYRPIVCRDAIKPGDPDCRKIRVDCGVDKKAVFSIGKPSFVNTSSLKIRKG